MELPVELVHRISTYLTAENVLELASESSNYNDLMILDINKCIDVWNIEQNKYVEGNMLWFTFIKNGQLGPLKYLYKYRRDICGMWQKSDPSPGNVISFTIYKRPENIEEYSEVSAETASFYKQHEVANWLKTITI